MPSKTPAGTWSRYRQLLKHPRGREGVPVPAGLETTARLQRTTEYWLDSATIDYIRKWVAKQGHLRVYCFITETSPVEAGLDFQIPFSELSEATLRSIPSRLERVFVAQDFSWAIHVDHEGTVTAAGSADFVEGVARANLAGTQGDSFQWPK